MEKIKVVEMRTRGMSQTEIARELQVSEASISLNMQYLRNQAKESIKEYVTEHLPEQYQICLMALDTILKHAYEILETSDDNRAKLQAMELFKDTHLIKLELLSNATTVDSSLNYTRLAGPSGFEPETAGFLSMIVKSPVLYLAELRALR
jgi:transcriptional regulator